MNTIKVSFWGDRTRSLCFRVEYRDMQFAATDRECAAIRDVKWSYAFTDVARIVRVYPWSITVLSPEGSGRDLYSTHRECAVVEWHLDVVKLFDVIERRRLRQFADKDEGQMTFKAHRFAQKRAVTPRLGVMQLVRKFVYTGVGGLGAKGAYHNWAKSLAIFAKMKPDKWAQLLDWFSIRAANPNDRVWACGDGELEFNLNGIRGAVICRGDDWSSHT